MSLLFYAIGTLAYKNNSTRNILAFTSGTGNTGYFGLPVIFAVLGEQAFSLATLSILGFVLYENTLGFYLTVKGNYSAQDSLKKVIKLPMVYAFIVGILLNIFSINLGDIAVITIGHFKGAYTLLGTMIIGMELATVKLEHIDIKFVSLIFLAKFLVWPLVIFALVLFDKLFMHVYSTSIYNVMTIMAIVPLAANTVAFATELKVHLDKAAFAVLLSTLFALFYIPLVVAVFIRI